MIPPTILGTEDRVIEIRDIASGLLKSTFVYRSQMRNKEYKIQCEVVINGRSLKQNKGIKDDGGRW